jgi:NADPH:quinone reductase-like Zn-dependent oxidoreductase
MDFKDWETENRFHGDSENKYEGIGLCEELLEAGKVVPVIDRLYPLSETGKALQYLGEGHARGKVVITVG